MISYIIYETNTFSKIYSTLTKKEQEWIEKIKRQLVINPKVGKPLKFDWFREKKFENKRLYYLVHPTKPIILLVSFSSKKEQQKVIDFIVKNKDEYLELLNTL